MIKLPENIDWSFEPEAMSPLALAYVGDAVYELYIRVLLVGQGSPKMKDLHRQAVKYVRAGTQAAFLKELEPLLTEEELAVVRWGRNAKSGHTPKSADVLEYRHSTGFEALIGYLYLKGRQERLFELLGELGPLIETSGGQEG
ncbi:MAG: ribonuclease III [Clostridia bacterium]|nr:ribonuclease III [Clostridia bacterium]